MNKIVASLISTLTCFSLFAQNWQQVYDIDENPSSYYVRAFDFYSEDYGAILSRYPDASMPNSEGIIHITKDGGLTWDTTVFNNTTITENNLQIPSDSALYFQFYEKEFIPNQFVHVRTGIKRSLDQGTTWTSHWIDTVYEQYPTVENNLAFLNDSMGVYICGKGVFYTGDYGESWSQISNHYMTNAGITNDKFVMYNYGLIHVYDPYADIFTTNLYPANCVGQVDFSNFKNQSAYRVLYAQDGPEQGYTANNYSVVIIDELPFGDQRVIHFPNQAYFGDIELTESGLFLQISGWVYRSMDNGMSFEKLPYVNSTTGVQKLAMINDTVGYALCAGPGIGTNPNYTLWKTTNGGGLSGDPVIINSFIGGVGLDEFGASHELTVSPNPSHGVFKIETESVMHKVEVFSLQGKKCFDRKVDSLVFDLGLNHLDKGTYFLVVHSEMGRKSKKIVLY